MTVTLLLLFRQFSLQVGYVYIVALSFFFELASNSVQLIDEIAKVTSGTGSRVIRKTTSETLKLIGQTLPGHLQSGVNLHQH